MLFDLERIFAPLFLSTSSAHSTDDQGFYQSRVSLSVHRGDTMSALRGYLKYIEGIS